MSENGSIRVALVDDQQLVRSGFRMILETEQDIDVVAEGENGRDAIRIARLDSPDVILLDIEMPVMNGIDATAEICAETDVKVLILTTFEQDDYVVAALRNGASGFLIKNAPAEEMIGAVRVVASGEALLSPSVTKRMIQRMVDTNSLLPSKELDNLTDREREVLVEVAGGATNAEIAETLFVSEATVKTHVSNVLAKLHLRDRVQAVVWAHENGVVQGGPS